jgi:alkaline phosphatase D
MRGPQFLHSVASGEPMRDAIVLWTRVTVDPESSSDVVTVSWSIREQDTDREVAGGEAVAAAEDDHTVHVDAAGLNPGTGYHYEFRVGDAVSPRGVFRTLPADPETVSFGVVSCAKFNAGYFNAYRGLAEQEGLQFVVCLGDYIYEAANVPPASQTPGAGIGRDFSPIHECYTLADYRQRYAQYRADPDTQALHEAHPMIATIDDHELADNAWAGGADEHHPDRDGPWSARQHAALRAWEEWMPTRRRPATRGDPIFCHVDVGSLFRLLLLETRTHRSDPAEPDPRKRSEFGHEQVQWMKQAAKDAAAPWLVVGVPSTVSPLWSSALDDEASFALRKLKLVEPKEGTPFHDLWDSFPGERHHLEDMLRTAPGTPVVLSGDVHVAVDSELREDGRLVAHEWTTSSVTSQNLDDKMGWPPRTKSLEYEAQVQAALPNIEWCDFDSHGWLVVTVESERASCEWWAVETVLSPTDRRTVSHRDSVTPRA